MLIRGQLEEGIWDTLHSSGQYFHKWFGWKYIGSAHQIVDIAQNVGGKKEQGSEQGKQKVKKKKACF